MKVEFKSKGGTVLFEGIYGSFKSALVDMEETIDVIDVDFFSSTVNGKSIKIEQLNIFRNDLRKVLAVASKEARGVKETLEKGRVNGATYEGKCCCLVGTIARIRGCFYLSMKNLEPDLSRPAEQWFMQIRKGDTPKNSKAAKLAHKWITEWIKNNKRKSK